MMKLIIGVNTLQLLEGEYLTYHDGRDGFPFNLDTSICGITDIERADELIIVLHELYPYTKYKIETPRVYTVSTEPLVVEVLFSMSDFTPIIKEG